MRRCSLVLATVVVTRQLLVAQLRDERLLWDWIGSCAYNLCASDKLSLQHLGRSDMETAAFFAVADCLQL